jgi:hypothetical protein
MDRSQSSPWSETTTTHHAIPSRWPWSSRTENTPTFTPPQVDGGAGMELTRLGGYAMVIALFTGCMLLNAWSRIDLRETAVDLDRVERRLTAAQAETTRLELEVSTLEDPAWLAGAATALGLDATAPVINMQSLGTR